LNFVGQLLSDEAVSLELVWLAGPPAAASSSALIEKVTERCPERVQFRTSEAKAGPGALRECAAGADLLVIALSPVWGLDVERSNSESVRLLADLPSSLILLHAKAS